MRRTKIVCTIGPASESVEILKDMIKAGMNVARLNFSHGTHREHLRRIEAIRRAASDVKGEVAILLDTRGPEIRLGELEREPVYLRSGQTVILTTREVKGTGELLPVTYKDLPRDVSRGNVILLADGLIALKVLETSETEVKCIVENGGELTSRKGINLPGIPVKLPSLTEQDKKDLLFGVRHGVDFIAASFVRRAADVLAIRKVVEEAGGHPDIIAKIENREAVDHLDEIIEVADGVMVARGDLGVEIPVEEVPLVQKMIIAKCNRLGKPVITATQMLESMINNPRPTRAEASDVANAIFDGTDAVMLSGETAIGKYVVEAVAMMSRIVARAEAALRYEEILQHKLQVLSHTVTDAISYATCSIAQDLRAAAIISSTESGYTARMVSKYRPKAPIIAVTPNQAVLRKLALVWGVQPLQVARTEDTDAMISAAVEASLAAGMINPGDLVVITAGVPVGVQGTTNLIKVHTVGRILVRGMGIGPMAVTGTVKVARTAEEAQRKVKPGDILVAVATDRDYVQAMKEAAAVITEAGGLTSHAAIVGLEFGIPVIVGAEGATSVLKDGTVVTVDGQRGLVYEGRARVL